MSVVCPKPIMTRMLAWICFAGEDEGGKEEMIGGHFYSHSNILLRLEFFYHLNFSKYITCMCVRTDIYYFNTFIHYVIYSSSKLVQNVGFAHKTHIFDTASYKFAT